MSEIVQYLSQFKRQDNQSVTHTIIGQDSYHLEDKDIKKLYKLIYKSKSKNLSVLERIGPISPLVIDIDLKYKEKFTDRQYTDEYLKQLYLFICNKIKLLFSNDDNNNNHLQMWIMEKENILSAPQNGYESKDGLHLLFPQLISDTKYYVKLIDTIFDSKEEYDRIVSETCHNPSSNDINEIFDQAPYKNGNWYIYSCGKKDENAKYTLTNIFTIDNDNNITENNINIYLSNPLDIIKKQSVQLNTDKTVEYIGEQIDEPIFKANTSNNNVNMNLYDFENIDNSNRIRKEDRGFLTGLVNLLSFDRATNYDDWIKTGFCIHSLSRTKFGYDLWIKFSKKSIKFDINSCNKQWQNMDRSGQDKFTLGSMIYWANKDNPDGYQKLRMDSLDNLILKSIKKKESCGAHADVVNVIHKYYRNEFVCAGLKENVWYYFSNESGKWKQTEQGHELRRRLSDDIVEIYQYYANKYKSMKGDDPESDDFDKYEKYNTNCYSVILKLKGQTYIDQIMKGCKDKFYDSEFNDKINTNLDIIGLNNCVIDLKQRVGDETKIMFREGIPDDFITISMGYDLPIERGNLPMSYEEVLDHIKEKQIDNEFTQLGLDLDDFFLKVLPYEDEREYTLRFLSSCLSGEVIEHKFYMWTGSGGNGKSLLVKLLNHTLGDYSKTLDVSYITKERGGSSNASPELEAIKHARFVSLSEPEKHDTIFAGKLKQITGGDTMTSRGLFKGTTEFTPQFKMMLMCNDLPSIPGVDGGIARRIEVVDFPSKFMEKPRPTEHNPHQYARDNTLEKRISDWNLVFLFKLLDYYTKFVEEGTKAPPSVTEATQEYFIENDLIQKWFKEDLTECQDTKSFNTLYQTFIAWCENEGKNHKKIEKSEIKKALEEEQTKGTYGLQYGKKASDKAPNGYPKYPQFNFCSNDDLDDSDND